MSKQEIQKAPVAHSSVSAPLIPMLQTRAFSQPDDLENLAIDAQPTLQAESNILSGHSLSRLNVRPPSPIPIQPKLTIGQVNDPYEQEADQMAAHVVAQMHAPQPLQRKLVQRSAGEEEELQMKPLGTSIQRVEEEEEELQMKSLGTSIQRVEEEEEELQMKPLIQRKSDLGGTEASTDLEASISRSRGGGQGLPDAIRQPMEQAFGANFSGVRIHSDSQSDQLNRSINARAFTTKNDIFFSAGSYNPGDRGGQELLAHELTHVVQQGAASVQRQPIKSVATVKGNSSVRVARMSNQLIQRDIMPNSVWRNETYKYVVSRGPLLTEIDEQIKLHHGREKSTIIQLNTFLKAIDAYRESKEGVDDSASRKKIIALLREQVHAEWTASSSQSATVQDISFKLMSPQLFLKAAGSNVICEKIAKKMIEFHLLSVRTGQDINKAIPILYYISDLIVLFQSQNGQPNAGINALIPNINEQIVTADRFLGKKISKRLEASGSAPQTAEELQQSIGDEVKKMRQQYSGSAESIFARVGSYFSKKLANMPGDKMELDAEIKIPVDPSGAGFLGGHMNFTIEVEKNQTTVRAELGFTGGAKVSNLAEIKAELGGYIESSAADAEKAMKLVSYSFYRRIRESRVVPRELGSYIWGGASDDVGYKLAEMWAGDVEKEIFGLDGGPTDEDAYVENGAYLAGSAQMGGSALGGAVQIRGNVGKKYNRASIKKAKGEIGKAQEESSMRFTRQDILGADTKGVELSGELNAACFKGGFSAALQSESQNGASETSWSLEANATIDLPGGESIGTVINGAINIGTNKVLDYLRTKGQLTGSPKWVGTNDLKELLDPSMTEAGANNLGCTIAIEGEGANIKTVQVSLDKTSSTEVDLELFTAGVKRQKRIIGATWENGWTLI
jgi:hypothetical protein